MNRRKEQWLTLLLVLLVLASAGGYAWYQSHVKEVFFVDALRSAGIAVPNNASLSSLELLYAQAMAERSPLFGIVGTDPTTLASAVSALATTTQNLVASQPNAQDAKLVQALYPINFLGSLAVTEAARQAFVADDSSANERAYDVALHATATAGSIDSKAFYAALQTEIGTSTFLLGTTNYPISAALMLQSASDIVARMSVLSEKLNTRDGCVAGNIAACDISDIALPQVVPASLLPSSAPLPQLSSDVMSILVAAWQPNLFANSQIVRLDSSLCLSAFPAPYYLVLRESDADPRARYVYVGDLFFTKLPAVFSKDIPFTQVYGITYLLDDPLEFYQCPEVEADISNIYAVVSTAHFAQTHLELAPADAAMLSKQVIDEGYARQYISQALQQATGSSTEQNALISLALEFNEENADLSTVVDEIAVLDQFNIDEEKQGMLQTETNITTLFFEHTGFLSLFLASNPSALPAIASIRVPEGPAALSGYLTSNAFYSTLRTKVPEGQIIHDVEGQLDFQQDIPPGGSTRNSTLP